MTVASAQSRVSFLGDNVSTVFGTSPMVFYNPTDLNVTVTNNTTGAVTTLVLNTHYTVSGGGATPATGTVTLTGWGALLSGTTLVVERILTETQQTHFVQNDPSDAAVAEATIDYLTMITQQLQAAVNRCVAFFQADVTGGSPLIPIGSIATRVGKFLGFDASGNIAVLTGTTTGAAIETTAQIIDTIAALKALPIPSAAVTYIVRGYYSSGDTGGGLFRWNSADASADNGGTIISPNSVPATGRWNRVLPHANVLDDRWFGVKADGVTNDFAAIQATFNALPSSGGTVEMHGGNRICNTGLTIPDVPFRLIGDGCVGNDVTTITFGAAVTNGFTGAFTSSNHELEIGGLIIKTLAAGLGTAIVASWPVQSSWIRNTCYLHDLEITFSTVTTTYWHDGILLTEAWNSTIERCTIILRPPTGQSFAAVGNAIAMRGSSNSIRVRNCWLYHASHGIDVGGTTQGVIIDTVVALSCDTCFWIAFGTPQPGSRITGCDTASYSGGMVLANYFDAIIDGNLFYQDPGSTNAGWIGVNVLNTSYQLRISNNITGGAIGFGANGINIQGGPNHIVVGNTIEVAVVGISIAAAATLISVGMNQYKLCTVNMQNLSPSATIFDQIDVMQPVTVTYSASMTPDARLGRAFVITATNGTAFTINAPSIPSTGQHIRITIRNTSGGALGAATWNGVFKMSAWTQPANGFSRSIEFRYDGTNWVQISQTGVDVPN